MTNLADNLAAAAREHAERVAVRLDGEMLTYRQLDDLASRLARYLADAGVAPGDRVGVVAPNVPAFPVMYYAVLRAGAIVVPMNPLLKRREVRHYLTDSGSTLLLAWHSTAVEAVVAAEQDHIRSMVVDADLLGGLDGDGLSVPRDDEDTAVILYTSGTTGRPKGAELSHANLRRNAEVANRSLLAAGPDDVIFGGLPLFHTFGQTMGMNVAVLAGACLTLVARFETVRVLEILERDRVSIFLGVPTMYVALLNAAADRPDADLSTLRRCVSGGAAMPVDVMHRFEQQFGCMVLEGYGLSETSPVASFNHPDRPRKPGSIGTPIEGVEFRLLGDDGAEVGPGEVGEIAVRGHNVMKGYWGAPQATAEAMADGWFRTGDLARRDADGYYYIVDRKKDMIIRGGYNVYPREVEEVLYGHPAVAEAVVVGVPHPVLGEEVAAAVAPVPGARPSPDELQRYVKERVAAYKYPRQVIVLDELPKGPTGKLLKREVAELIPPDA